MTQKTEEQRELQQNMPPRPYHSPRLLMYGRLQELTAGGSGSTQEQKTGNGGCSQDPNRSRC